MDIWREGKYIDLWSVNHFLSGIVFTGWFLVFGFTFGLIFILYLIVAIGWEWYEVKRGIYEHPGNKVMDVVMGVLGVFILYFYSIHLYILAAVTLIYLLMEMHGYITYKNRTVSQSSSHIIHSHSA